MKTFIPLPVISQNIPIELRQFCQNVLEYLRNLRQELAGFFGQGEIDATTGAEHLILQPNGGNVGIGTTSPQRLLHVHNPGTEATDSTFIQFTTGDTGSASGAVGGVIGYSASDQFNIWNYQDTQMQFATNATARMTILNNGNVGIGTTEPTALVDINSNKFRLRTAETPASASAAGNAGDICWDSNYIYVCVATNTWKRVALSTW